MARIELGKPYEEYLKRQVELGYFRNITAAAENAILRRMEDPEQRRISRIHELIAEGQRDFDEGRSSTYTPELMSKIKARAIQAFTEGESIKPELRP